MKIPCLWIPPSHLRWIILTFSILVSIILIFEMTDWDLRLAELFYDRQAGRWITAPYNDFLQRWLHYNLKVGLIVIGAVSLLSATGSFWIPRLRRFRRLLMLVAAMGLITSAVAGLKSLTNTYCPSQIVPFGGGYPYVKVLESYPEGFAPGKEGYCFPAAHASLGFAFLALYFILPGRWRWAGLAGGLGLGWIMGLYQMARGAHFMSHTITTMLVAWIIVLILDAMFRRWPQLR